MVLQTTQHHYEFDLPSVEVDTNVDTNVAPAYGASDILGPQEPLEENIATWRTGCSRRVQNRWGGVQPKPG